MTTQHNEVNVLCLYYREDSGGGLACYHRRFGVDFPQAVHMRKTLQIDSGLFQFSIAGALHEPGIDCRIR